jgi:hypothetical protein
MPASNPGKLNVVNCWISDIREAKNQAAKELATMDTDAAVARLCELNVMRQVGEGWGSVGLTRRGGPGLRKGAVGEGAQFQGVRAGASGGPSEGAPYLPCSACRLTHATRLPPGSPTTATATLRCSTCAPAPWCKAHGPRARSCTCGA